MAGKKSPQIKSKKRVQDFAEVYTAKREVKSMCDLIPPDMWQDIVTAFLEPACGNGAFLKEILSRKLSHCVTPLQGLCALESIYGIEIQADNVEESKQALFDIFLGRFGKDSALYGYIAMRVLDRNIVCADSLVLQKLLETRSWDEAVRLYKSESGKPLSNT